MAKKHRAEEKIIRRENGEQMRRKTGLVGCVASRPLSTFQD